MANSKQDDSKETKQDPMKLKILRHVLPSLKTST